MKDKIRFVILLRIHSRPRDIDKRFFNRIKKYGGSKTDFFYLMGYHSKNKTALKMVNWLIAEEILKAYSINGNGNFNYKVDYRKLKEEIEKFPEFNSIDDFIIPPILG